MSSTVMVTHVYFSKDKSIHSRYTAIQNNHTAEDDIVMKLYTGLNNETSIEEELVWFVYVDWLQKWQNFLLIFNLFFSREFQFYLSYDVSTTLKMYYIIIHLD